MSVKDIGIFINARHFEQIAEHDREPDKVLDRVEETANVLMLAGGVAHRVVVADCAQENERLIAESFASDCGFRIRHRPNAGPSHSTLLGAEILESMNTSPWLRTFVIGDSLAAQSAVIDVIHRQRRWVIGLVSEHPLTPRISDLTYTLPLSRAAVYPIVTRVIEEIKRTGQDPTPTNVQKRIKQLIPGFTARAYGFDTIEKLIEASQGNYRNKKGQPRTRRIVPATPPRILQNLATSARRDGDSANPQAPIREAVLRLPTPSAGEVSTMSDCELGCYVLAGLDARVELHDNLRAGNLTVQLFAAGIRHVIGDPKWRPTMDSNFNVLMSIAAQQQGGWSVACPPNNEHPRLVLGNELPEGWTSYTLPAVIDRQDTSSDCQQGSALDHIEDRPVMD